MRRLLVAALLASSLPVLLAAPAPAQDDDTGVRLVLEEQTTTASPDRSFVMRLRIVNDGEETLRDLSLTFWLYPAVRSRSEYEQAIDVDLPTPLKVETLPLEHRTLAPGDDASVRLEPRIGILKDLRENALYPARVQLSSGLEPVAVLRTAFVYLVRPPLIGLNVALTFVLDAPLVLGPRGVFADDTLEAALAPGGRLRRIIDVLDDVPTAVTLVVSPMLLQQLQAMVPGYQVVDEGGLRAVGDDAPGSRRAERALEAIAEIARRPDSQLVALPYASPSLAALTTAGMTEDLEAQLSRGRAATEAKLGVEPTASLLWPPASVVTEDSLDALAAAGIRDLVVDAETLPPPAGTKFTPSAVGLLETEGGAEFRVLTPDPLIDARLSQLPDDPRLRAQWVLGELAAIYFEHPGWDRGVSIVFGEDDEPEAAFLRRLVNVLRSPDRSPWVRAVAASRLLEPEDLEPPPDRRSLREPEQVGRFPSTYLDAVEEAREAIAQVESIGAEPETVDHLRELVLLSQSRYLLGDDERRLGYLDRVHEVVSEEFAKIQTPEPGVVTLTSLHGEVPVTIRNLSGRDIEVQITLQSSRLEFLEGSTHTVTLSPPAQRFEFPVRAETTGRFGVHVEVRTPLGAEIAETDIVVRSTAYNRVALFVTIGAALFLLGWWARRFLPRRS